MKKSIKQIKDLEEGETFLFDNREMTVLEDITEKYSDIHGTHFPSSITLEIDNSEGSREVRHFHKTVEVKVLS